MLNRAIAKIRKAQEQIDSASATLSKLSVEIAETGLKNMDENDLDYIENKLFDLNSLLNSMTSLKEMIDND